jgi:hypothetical protein
MRLLLDEHLPIGLSAELHGHALDTVSGRRWSGIKNGELLCRQWVDSGPSTIAAVSKRRCDIQTEACKTLFALPA